MMERQALVLGVESSCDDTGLAIYSSEQGLVAHVLYSQTALHQPYGGVVPELASRDHVQRLVPLLDQVLERAHLPLSRIDAIAYTAGPGLVGALLTGACFAKSLAFARNIPCIAVHHLEAHLLAAKMENPTLDFPFLALLVSGGHTQLLEARSLGDYRLLGETLDDAVGEAFDKTAKTLGLSYPGGALLAQLAEQPCSVTLPTFPRPMTDRPGLDFSFSGLKTHARLAWENSSQDTATQIAIAREFQAAVVDTLVWKCKQALDMTQCPRLVVAGGVGANRVLRQRLAALMEKYQGKLYFPRPEFCTDNGAMIAYTGCMHLLVDPQQPEPSLSMDVYARWPLPTRCVE